MYVEYLIYAMANVADIITNYYLIEGATVELAPRPFMKDKLYEYLKERKKIWLLNASYSLLGASIVACWGEARHAYNKRSPGIDLGIPSSRSEVYYHVLHEPQFYLENFSSLRAVFNKGVWCKGYGGKSWAKIVHATLELAKSLVSREISEITLRFEFLISLEHNNNLWLDKFHERLVYFLDLRRYCSLKSIITGNDILYAFRLSFPDTFRVCCRYGRTGFDYRRNSYFFKHNPYLRIGVQYVNMIKRKKKYLRRTLKDLLSEDDHHIEQTEPQKTKVYKLKDAIKEISKGGKR